MGGMLRANLKKFMGARYERLPRSLVIIVVAFFAVNMSGFRLDIAPSVLFVTIMFMTIWSFIHVLSSDDTIDSIRGQLMLPVVPLHFHLAFLFSIILYVLLNQVGLVLAAYLALSQFTLPVVLGAILCFVASGIATYALAFRSEKRNASHPYSKHQRHSFILYLIRYLKNNASYVANTLALWVFGCVFAFITSETDFNTLMPLGLVLMCINTPLGILLSSDKALSRDIAFLPNQNRQVLMPYAVFVAIMNLASCSLYLAAWQVLTGSLPLYMPFMALFVAVASAAITVYLEIKHPVLNWNVTSDLWRNPRKYVVPGIMLLIVMSITLLLS